MKVLPNGSKAVISLTSWRARINTVGITIFSIIKMCPTFHIVLVLSEEEFPKKEAELPDDLNLLVRSGLLELLWIYPNLKSLKKVLPTMRVYSSVPIISADDDCMYICNYAQIMYDKWLQHPDDCVKYTQEGDYKGTQGPSTLYNPKCFSLLLNEFDKRYADNVSAYSGMDDAFMSETLLNNGYKIIPCSSHYCFRFHNEIGAIHPNLSSLPLYKECYSPFKGVY